jgi:hypothetical protein
MAKQPPPPLCKVEAPITDEIVGEIAIFFCAEEQILKKMQFFLDLLS